MKIIHLNSFNVHARDSAPPLTLIPTTKHTICPVNASTPEKRKRAWPQPCPSFSFWRSAFDVQPHQSQHSPSNTPPHHPIKAKPHQHHPPIPLQSATSPTNQTLYQKNTLLIEVLSPRPTKKQVSYW